jgi:hypothetical protein
MSNIVELQFNTNISQLGGSTPTSTVIFTGISQEDVNTFASGLDATKLAAIIDELQKSSNSDITKLAAALKVSAASKGGAFGESYMINPSTAPPAPVQSTPVGSYMINPSTAPYHELVLPTGFTEWSGGPEPVLPTGWNSWSDTHESVPETAPGTPVGISAINPSVIHIHRHSHANGAEPHSHEFHQ